MYIYYVADQYGENVEFVDEQTFFAKKGDAEAELDERVAHLHAVEDKNHERRVNEWRINHKAVRLIIDAGLPIPFSLAHITNTPPERKTIRHTLEVMEVEVID